MSRNCLVVDLDKCIGCHACEVACKNENGIALGEYWNRVLQIGPHGTFPDLEQYWLPVQCQQCEDAPCVHVCPTGASYRDADGKVLVDKEKCIGCKYCMMACPYGVRSWNTKEKRRREVHPVRPADQRRPGARVRGRVLRERPLLW